MDELKPSPRDIMMVAQICAVEFVCELRVPALIFFLSEISTAISRINEPIPGMFVLI